MPRSIDARAEALIKQAESCELTAYRCPAGVLTIGYGHTGPDVVEGETIDQPTAEMLLRRDIARFEGFVEKTCPLSNEAQFGAMVSLCYNIGEANFVTSSVARLHNAGRVAEAAQAFALWNKAKGKVLGGLVARRAQEAALYLADGDAQDMPQAVEGEKPLSQSRAINGQTIAGAATAAGIGVDEARGHTDAFGAAQDAIYSLLPYFDALKWVLVAVVLAGIAYAVYARAADRHEGRA